MNQATAIPPQQVVSTGQSIIYFSKKEILQFKPLHNQRGKNGQALISSKRVADLLPNITRILTSDASPIVVFNGIEVDSNGNFVRDYRNIAVIIEGHHRQATLLISSDSMDAVFPVLVLTGNRTTSDLENRATLSNISHSKKSQVWQLLYSGSPFATNMFVPIYDMVDAELKPFGYKEEEIFKIAGRLVAMELHPRSDGKRWGIADHFSAKKYDETKPTWVNVDQQWQNDPTLCVDIRPELPKLRKQFRQAFTVLADLRSGEHETGGLKSNILWPILGLASQNLIGADRLISANDLAKVINRDASLITRKLCIEFRKDTHKAEKWFKKHVKKYLESKGL